MARLDLVPIKRALISVSDKTGIVEFARDLHAQGVEILSTGGTFKLLQENRESLPLTPRRQISRSCRRDWPRAVRCAGLRRHPVRRW